MKAWKKTEDEGLRAQIEVACVGKTHIAIQFVEKLIRKLKNKKTIIVVLEPRIELIRQTMQKWSQHLPEDIKETMKVCTVCTIGWGSKPDESEDDEGNEEEMKALMEDKGIDKSLK